MAHDDPTLQELIVRALTGGDRAARRSLDAVAAADPELRSFCQDLDDIVNSLVGAGEWRLARPSPELTARVREAVVKQLPAAPPHFQKVLMEADLGRRRTQRALLLGALSVAAATALLVVFWYKTRGPGDDLKLRGTFVYESRPDVAPARDFEVLGGGTWRWDGEGLRNTETAGAGALFLKKGFAADEALAFRLDVGVPGLEARSSVVAFLADAAGETSPAFNNSQRPVRGLTLEISRDGLVLYDGDQLLQSRPRQGAQASFFRVRMEHLGARVRIMVNGERFFVGAVSRAPKGPLHPGMRIMGPRKGGFRFNKIRVER